MSHASQHAAPGPAASVPARAKAVTAGADPVVASVSLSFAAAMRAANVSHRQLAGALGIDKRNVTNWCDPLSERVPNFRHEALIRAKLPRLYDELTRRRQPASRPVDCVQRGTMLAHREGGRLADVVLDALGDGRISRDEARQIARAAADAEAVYAAIRLRAEASA